MLGTTVLYKQVLNFLSNFFAGLWTEAKHFWTVPATPDPPAVVNQTEDSIDISWSSVDIAEEANYSSFHVQYRRDKAEWKPAHTTNTWISLTGLAAGETYQIKVRVLSSQGDSAWSAPAKAKTEERTETQLEKSKKDLGINKLVDQVNILSKQTAETNTGKKRMLRVVAFLTISVRIPIEFTEIQHCSFQYYMVIWLGAISK